jgi:hypothetical protein
MPNNKGQFTDADLDKPGQFTDADIAQAPTRTDSQAKSNKSQLYSIYHKATPESRSNIDTALPILGYGSIAAPMIAAPVMGALEEGLPMAATRLAGAYLGGKAGSKVGGDVGGIFGETGREVGSTVGGLAGTAIGGGAPSLFKKAPYVGDWFSRADKTGTLSEAALPEGKNWAEPSTPFNPNERGGSAWSLQRKVTPELQQEAEGGNPQAQAVMRRLNPNAGNIIIPRPRVGEGGYGGWKPPGLQSLDPFIPQSQTFSSGERANIAGGSALTDPDWQAGEQTHEIARLKSILRNPKATPEDIRIANSQLANWSNK